MRGVTDSTGCTKQNNCISIFLVYSRPAEMLRSRRWKVHTGISTIMHYPCDISDMSRKEKHDSKLTPNTRKTFLAAATEAWIFFALPGSPAEMNMHVYCNDMIRTC